MAGVPDTKALKVDLEKDFKLNLGQFELFENRNAKNTEIWNSFRLIKKDGEVLPNVCACRHCYACYVYQNAQSRSTGTKNLQQHISGCRQRSASGFQPKLTASMLNPKPKLSSSQKAKVKQSAIEFVVKGRHPFTSVENDGLLDFCQMIADLGATCGKFDVRDIIPKREAVSRGTKGTSNLAKDQLKPELASAKDRQSLSITVDMATDDHMKRSYLSVHAQWVDANFEFQNCLLALRHFGTQSHTGRNIHDMTEEILREYGLDLAETPVVTDMGSNMLSAFDEDGLRLTCLAHREPIDTIQDEPLTGDVPANEQIENEIAAYKGLAITDTMKENRRNPLAFWKSEKSKFPILSRVAVQIFAIPASSAGSERDFSGMGRVLTKFRASLKPEKVEMIEFLNSVWASRAAWMQK